MTTVLDALQKGTGYLEKQGVESPRLTMQLLLAHLLKCDRMQLYVDFERPLAEEELARLREWMRARAHGKPVQHILGRVEFYGREFLCDERALIPRPETEQLVDLLVKMEWPEGLRILDMGCGSGVIGLSLAAGLRDLGAEVTLADCSGAALELARENADLLGEELKGVRLSWVESDLLGAVEGRFGLMVANLPYVSTQEMEELSVEVRRDPVQALHGGERGTEIVERFLVEAWGRGESGATAAMEVGHEQADFLGDKAREAGWAEVEVRRDLEGRERFLLVRKGKVE